MTKLHVLKHKGNNVVAVIRDNLILSVMKKNKLILISSQIILKI
jgi:hypothetical protein